MEYQESMVFALGHCRSSHASVQLATLQLSTQTLESCIYDDQNVPRRKSALREHVRLANAYNPVPHADWCSILCAVA